MVAIFRYLVLIESCSIVTSSASRSRSWWSPRFPSTEINSEEALEQDDGGSFARRERAALMGELLASELAGDPLPLERGLVEAVDPARYLLRPARRLLDDG